MNINSRIHRILNWEYWPSSMFYIPNLPYALYLAYKARHLAFFTAANPGIKSSGNGTESKFETLQLIPEKYRPKSILITPKTPITEVIAELSINEILFPVIVKPDIGFRGLLVKKIESKEALKAYLIKNPVPMILQEFISYENECGLFYVRNPNKSTGKITSITLKNFLFVVGDGHNSVENLIYKSKRANLYLDIIKEMGRKQLQFIPEKNKKVHLSVVGNHCKGTQFINGNHLISDKLNAAFDKINKSIKGWYYGRLDIKYNSFEDLENGKNFKILEINGIMAEPTHIYDSTNFSYFKALKEIRVHWGKLYQISKVNHEVLKTPYKSPKEFAKEMISLKNYVSSIKKLN